eukprot:scpid86193/ scgid2541/ Metallophosphoesterase domain-containing protein 1; Adult brain protein 239
MAAYGYLWPESRSSTSPAGVPPALLEQSTPMRPDDVWSSEAGQFVLEHRSSPHLAWEMYREVCPVQAMADTPVSDPFNQPCQEGYTRFVCISDTHGMHGCLQTRLPWGHVLLHAGDFSHFGRRREVQDVNDFFAQLPHEHKVVIAGNHDLTFDAAGRERFLSNSYLTRECSSLRKHDCATIKSMLTECVYVEDEEVTVRGFRIYGSPWQPKHSNWAFNLDRGQPLIEKWRKIPSGIDILMTHGPPFGHGDLCSALFHAGCVDLLAEVQRRIRPKYHVFGHIHEGHGVTSDGTTVFINAAICDVDYYAIQDPIVFDLPNPTSPPLSPADGGEDCQLEADTTRQCDGDVCADAATAAAGTIKTNSPPAGNNA